MKHRIALATAASLAFGPGRARADDTCGCLVVEMSPAPQVKVSRGGTGDWITPTLHLALKRGDLLEVEGAPGLKLACDGTAGIVSLPVTPRRQPVPCSVSARPKWVIVDGRPRDAARLGIATPRIVLLRPCGTAVRESRPDIRWRRVPGVKEYTITVRGSGNGTDSEWRTTVNVPDDGAKEGSLRYPATAPPLKRGVPYKVFVAAAGFANNDAPVFRRLSDAESKKVARALETIRRLGLGSAEPVALAHLYAAHGLHADAVDALETVRSSTAQSLYLLADELRYVSRTTDAAKVLVSATSLPYRDTEPREDQAKALETLANLQRLVGDDTSAAQSLASERVLRQQLGETERIKKIDEMVKVLNPGRSER